MTPIWPTNQASAIVVSVVVMASAMLGPDSRASVDRIGPRSSRSSRGSIFCSGEEIVSSRSVFRLEMGFQFHLMPAIITLLGRETKVENNFGRQGIWIRR